MPLRANSLDYASPVVRYAVPVAQPGIEGLFDDFVVQRAFIEARVPVYARLLQLLEAELAAGTISAFTRQLAELWAERVSHANYERPLLLLAALRYDALCEPANHPLASALTGEPPDLAQITLDTVRAAVAPERARFWSALATRAVQTNETSRAVAWLWPAALLHELGAWREMALLDLGTSAGLNLIADALPMPWREPNGQPFTLAARPQLALRLGLDRAPLDARDADTAQWLRACVWPGEPARSQRLEAGIARFRAAYDAPGGPRVEACDLRNSGARLDQLSSDLPVLAVQTIVRDYLPDAAKLEHAAGMRAWLTRRTPRSAAWIELELAPGGSSMDTAATITLHMLERARTLREVVLARCNPHPGVIHVQAEGLAELRELMTA
jgi:hypothetical protein